MHAGEPGQVDHREEEVPQLLLQGRLVNTLITDGIHAGKSAYGIIRGHRLSKLCVGNDILFHRFNLLSNLASKFFLFCFLHHFTLPKSVYHELSCTGQDPIINVSI